MTARRLAPLSASAALGLFLSGLLQPLGARDCGATSIVCLRSPDSVVIAADSMVTVRNEKEAAVAEPECKLLQAGSCFYALAGFYRDPARGFDVRSVVQDAIGAGSGFSQNAEQVAGKVTGALVSELGRIRAEAPAAYAGIRQRGGTLVNLLLASWEDGTPKVVLLKFNLAGADRNAIAVSVEKEFCPGQCNPRNITAFYLTDRRAIDAYLKKGGALDWGVPEQTARFLVNLVIESGAEGVAPPIDVLRLDRNGARWVGRKEQCPDVAPPLVKR